MTRLTLPEFNEAYNNGLLNLADAADKMFEEEIYGTLKDAEIKKKAQLLFIYTYSLRNWVEGEQGLTESQASHITRKLHGYV